MRTQFKLLNLFYNNAKQKLSNFFIVCLSSIFPLSALAADDSGGLGLGNAATSSISAQTMLVNIAKQVPALTSMVTALAYIMGLYLIISAIIRLKHVGEARSMMSPEHNIKIPLTMLAIGAMLTYLPSAVQVGLSTFWTDPNPYGYLDKTSQWTQFINTVFIVVQFIGVVAFIRGLVMLRTIGQHGGQQGSLGRGLTHIIGGIFCINIYQFVQLVLGTLGVSVNFLG